MGQGAGLFVVLRRYAPPFDPSRRLEEQPEWEAHRVFMNNLEARGIVRLGGPLEGHEKVLLIFRAASANEVTQHLNADPWTISGLLCTEAVYHWDLRLGQIPLNQAPSGRDP